MTTHYLDTKTATELGKLAREQFDDRKKSLTPAEQAELENKKTIAHETLARLRGESPQG